MKSKVIILFAMFGFVSLTMFAQKGNPERNRSDKMKSVMIGRISNQLNLTPEEAEKFWPVFNEMQAKRQELRKPMRDEMSSLRKSKENGQPPMEAEYQKMVSLSLDYKVKDAELTKTYFEKFGKILPAEKVFKLERIGMQAKEKIAHRFDKMKDKKDVRYNKDTKKGKKQGKADGESRSSADKKG